MAPGDHSRTWYSVLSLEDRQFADAVALWLAPVRWQYFVTLEFTRDVVPATAIATLKKYMSRVGEAHREPICFVGGLENESKVTGMKVRRHFHLLLTAQLPIPATILKQHWRDLVGVGAKDRLQPEGSSIVVEPVDPQRPGIEYCLKFANHCNGEWIFRWLEIFNPKIPRSANYREVRQRRRAAARSASIGRGRE